MVTQDGKTKSWLLNHPEQTKLAKESLEEIQEELNEPCLLVIHNAKFDINWLRWVGLDLSKCKVFCTMVADYLINGQRRIGYSLNQVAKRHGVQLKQDKVKLFWTSGYNTDEVPASVLIPYMEQDAINHLALFQRQSKELRKLGLTKLMKLYMENLLMLSEAECTGLYSSKEKAEGFVEEFNARINEIDTRLTELFKYPININSSDQLSSALFGGTFEVDGREEYEVTLKSGEVKQRSRKCKVPVKLDGLGFIPPKGSELKKSTKDRPYYSTSKDVITQLRGKTKLQKEVLELLLEHSLVNKALTTFVSSNGDKGLISQICDDGCVHPSFNQTVTATGRLSSSSPNGQNLDTTIKKMFIPRNDGILNCDLGQLEFRVAAALSWDEVMIQEIRGGLDVHTDNALRFFGDVSFRKYAKIFVFRLIYGGTAKGFYHDSKMPDFSEKRWREIVSAFFEKYRGLKMWHNELIREVFRNGYLRNPSGRLLKFDKHKSLYTGVMEYNKQQIVNYPVQSGSADLVYLAMASIYHKMRKYNFKSKFILCVHDSYVFDCLEKERDNLAEICINTFEDLPRLAKNYWGWEIPVPMTGDVEWGSNYGELEKLEV